MTIEKYTPQFKRFVLQKYINGETGPDLERQYQLPSNSVKRWVKQYPEYHKLTADTRTTPDIQPEPEPVIDVIPHDNLAPSGDDALTLLKQLVRALTA